MASTTTRMMTVEEFAKLPETPAHICELHNGEIVKMTRPVYRHLRIQHRLQRFLGEAAGDPETVYLEAPFRPLREYEVRVADLAYAPKQRWQEVPQDGYFMGTPDLVVEILSPSNSAAEMLAREQICLENGAREFWIVDPEHKQVKISTPEGRTATYKSDGAIPIFFAPGPTIAVDAIFETSRQAF
jgi:Uma2 family endonuclease